MWVKLVQVEKDLTAECKKMNGYAPRPTVSPTAKLTLEVRS